MNYFTKITGSICLILISMPLIAHDVTKQGMKSTTLKHVMQGLLKDSQKISEGIFLQKYKQIEQAAARIADHPSPSADIMQKLVKSLGAEMGVFKNFDIQVHDTAIAIVKAAKDQDMKLVVTEYHQLVDGCQSCHGSFKQRVSKILE
jgi:cytochrome c556